MSAAGIFFDPALPINARRDEIRAAVERHPVVVVCGETGSGKSTQLPKLLLDMGRAEAGRIAHTQPRRIAARSVAARIAQELGTRVGERVGYKVRFQEQLGARTAIKVVTDGILLAETQGDRELSEYGSIILDEAHERSLNIDFLLGYLKPLLERRPELKVLVTSATLDAERFSRHFGGAPVIEVSGRLYPVELRYRPVGGDTEDTTREEEEQALVDAVQELCAEGEGDVLVFLPGEREIRDASAILGKRLKAGSAEILPLYSRLSAAEQDRVFKPAGKRRIVLATNVAETSLTVPRVRYVVDTGTARIKRYSYRNKVEMLRVEPISQAAARQRAGRCGRMANGICIRLYSEEELARRPAYTDPEVLRSSLASVILRAKSLGLGEVEGFPFLDAPSPRAVADGYALLGELGAVDEQKKLTSIGQELARLPLDPRIARMLVAARSEGCLSEVRTLAAALSVQDPRERPLDKAGAADERHARFADERSDFLAYLKMAKLFEEKLERQARENFLSIPRMREWRDVDAQLARMLAEMHWHDSSVDPTAAGGYRAIHRALLAGLLGNVGLKEEAGEPASGAYTGARGIKLWIHPGSWVKKPGRWIVAAELVETTRLYARTVAAIDPKWLEDLAAPLLERERHDPRWERRRGEVLALERGTLYGLPVYANRRVPYARFDAAAAREIFIRSALVQGELDTHAPFFAHNRRLVAEIERLEHKSRRPDILVDEALIHAFYDARIPAEVNGAAGFERWRAQAERAAPKLLFLSREDLMRHEAAGITTDNFPPYLELGPNRYGLEYHFEPGSPKDGVTLVAPLALLNQVPLERTQWLVPGMLGEKVRTLAKSLPQRLRHKLGGLDEFAQSFTKSVPPANTSLTEALVRYIRAERGIELPIDALRPDAAPPHLQMNFRVLDEHGRQLATGRDLAALKRDLGGQARSVLRAEAPVATAERYTGWTLGALPELVEIERGGQTLVGYPALVDAGDAVTLEVFDSPEQARAAHRGGVRRLLALAFRERIRELERSLGRDVVLGALKADLVSAALERTFLAESVPSTPEDFAARVEQGRSRFNLIAQEIVRIVAAILAERAALEKRLAGVAKPFPQPAAEIREQLARLLAPGWIARTPWPRLQHFSRYLKAAALRIDKLREDPQRERRLAAELAALEVPFRREVAAAAGEVSPELEQFGWLLEELRVALFAQALRTPVPVSTKRLARLWQTVRK